MNETGQLGWGLWLRWVLANNVGILIGGVVGNAVSGAVFSVEGGALALALAFAVSSAVFGTAQWLVLRRHLTRIDLWILTTTLSFALFGALYERDPLSFALVFTMVGAVVGVAQWLILREHLSRAGWWVLVSAMGFAVYGVVPRVFERITEVEIFAIGVAVVFLMVATYGAITGITLVWLLNRSTMREEDPHQAA